MNNLKCVPKGVPKGTQYIRYLDDGDVMYYRVNSEGAVEFHLSSGWGMSQYESIDELGEFTNIQSKGGFDGH